MHPADELRGIKSNKLSKKRIVLGVTGSIAAVETIKLSRELIRHGAEVVPVMTHAATTIIHPDALEFATGNKPIIELTGKTEHVSLCGRVKKPVDLLLISPCTANTLSKIAHGIDDTPVTTFATTALGSGIPILIVPAMHLSMYDHKIIQENIQTCKKASITFIEPSIQGTKAKMVSMEEVVSHVMREIGTQDLADKKILIVGGSTAESIDDVRVIINRSSGKTAVWLAKNAFYRSADVELWYGYNSEHAPKYIKTESFESLDDLLKLSKTKILKNFDIIIVCAAIADYLPKKQKGKIPSGKKKLVLEMSPATKFIATLRTNAPTSKIIGFKVEEQKNTLKQKATDLLRKNRLDVVVANTIAGFGSEENEILFVDKNGAGNYKKGTKEQLADRILDAVK